MKKLTALFLVLVSLIGFTACAEEKMDATFSVAIVVAELNEWNQNYEAAVKSECEAYGWSYRVFDAGQDASTQIQQVEEIIESGFDAMTIQSVDNAALASVVGKAADSGIIVVDHYDFDESLGINDKIYKLLMDQKAAGTLEAEEYIKTAGTEGKVAIIAGLQSADNARQRTAGMEEVLAAYPDIELVATVYCDWDAEKAQTAAEEILEAYPDLKGFLVQDDGMSKGVLNAVEAASLQSEVVIASQGFYEWSVPYIKEGKFAFTITYPASFAASDAMKLIKAVSDGETVERVRYQDMELVTIENVDTAAHD